MGLILLISFEFLFVGARCANNRLVKVDLRVLNDPFRTAQSGRAGLGPSDIQIAG